MIVVAITGASGVIYGIRLLEALNELKIENSLIISDTAKTVIKTETDWEIEDIIKLADNYYNFTCKYMLGMFSSIKSKKEIINLIKLKHSSHRTVKFATNYPTIFAILSNCTVPIFRIARYIRRKQTAKRLTTKNSKQ